MAGETIFLSYRRGDTGGHAGALYRDLEREFPGQVFKDSRTLQPGERYAVVLRDQVSSCRVLLAVIGPDWLNARDEQGRRRVDDPHDLLRMEIATTLGRGDDVLVIPVLMGGAVLPRREELPANLRPLVDRQYIELTESGYDDAFELLVEVIRRKLGLPEAPEAPDEPEERRSPPIHPRPPRRRWIRAMVLGAGLVAGAYGTYQLAEQLGFPVPSGPSGQGRTRTPVRPSTEPEVHRVPMSRPTLILSTSSGPPGTTLKLTGSGFRPGERVRVLFHTTEVGSARADARGWFGVPVTIPANWKFRNAQFRIAATGEDSLRFAQEPFDVR